MKQFFCLFAFFIVTSNALAQNEVDRKFFKTEFGCYSQIAENSSLSNESISPQYYYPLVTKQADKWLGVEARSKGGTHARLYIFTEDGAYIKDISQNKSWQEFRYNIKLEGQQKLIGLDRTEKDSKYRSLMFVAEEFEPALKLSLETGERVRKVLIDSIAEKIQSMRSTFDAISDNRRRTLSALLKKDLAMQGKAITLETYFESLPEKTQQQISQKQNSEDYIRQLKDCKVALGTDEKYETLRSLVDAEILKFNHATVPAVPGAVTPQLKDEFLR